jgi:O-antigen/teichoic acid export membrane protein
MGSNDDLSTLLSSAALVMIGTIVFSGSNLIERIVISRALPLGAYGRVGVSISILQFGTTLAAIGLTQGVPRYMSRFSDERDVRGIWAVGLAITLAFGTLIASVLVLNADRLVPLVFDRVDPTSKRLFVLFSAAIPLYAGLKMGDAGIRGFEVTIYRTYSRDLLYPITRLVALAALLFVGFRSDAAGYAYLLACAGGFLVSHLLLGRLMSLVGEVRTHTREMVSFSLPLVLATFITILLLRTDTLMIAYFESDVQVGLYEYAYPLAGAMSLALTAFGFLYLPMTSRLDADGRLDEVNVLYQVTTKWIYIVTFPAFLAFTVFSSDVLQIFFSERAAAAGPALTILSVGFFVSAAAGRSRETLSALGNTRAVLFSNAVAFAINVALNLVLIPRFGFVGAAVTSALSYTSLYTLVYFILRRNYGITPFSRRSTRTFLLLPLLVFPPTVLLAQFVSLSVLTLPVFLVGAGLVTVAVVALTGCLQVEDAVPLDLVERRLGVEVPLLRRYIPDSEASEHDGIEL